MTPPLLFTFALIVMYVGHKVGDHWVQTDTQAVDKGEGGPAAWLASLRHVATLTATIAALLALSAWLLDVHLDAPRVAAGLVFNAATHWFIDLRWPLKRLAADHLGKSGWIRSDPTALYNLDQSAHLLFLLFTALIISA